MIILYIYIDSHFIILSLPDSPKMCRVDDEDADLSEPLVKTKIDIANTGKTT